MTSAIGSSTSGLQSAFVRLDDTASRVARVGTDLPGASGVDLAAEAANLVQARVSAEANGATLRVASDMQKRLLDVLV